MYSSIDLQFFSYMNHFPQNFIHFFHSAPLKRKLKQKKKIHKHILGEIPLLISKMAVVKIIHVNFVPVNKSTLAFKLVEVSHTIDVDVAVEKYLLF